MSHTHLLVLRPIPIPICTFNCLELPFNSRTVVDVHFGKERPSPSHPPFHRQILGEITTQQNHMLLIGVIGIIAITITYIVFNPFPSHHSIFHTTHALTHPPSHSLFRLAPLFVLPNRLEYFQSLDKSFPPFVPSLVFACLFSLSIVCLPSSTSPSFTVCWSLLTLVTLASVRVNNARPIRSLDNTTLEHDRIESRQVGARKGLITNRRTIR